MQDSQRSEGFFSNEEYAEESQNSVENIVNDSLSRYQQENGLKRTTKKVRAETGSRTIQGLSEDQILSMREAENRFQEFKNTLGTFLTKRLPQNIYEHIYRKPHKLKSLNHSQISQYVTERIDKMIKTKRMKKNWTFRDLMILIWVVGKYTHLNKIKDVYYGIKKSDWEVISSMIPSSTGQNCMFKWLGLKKINQQWRKSEESILVEIAKKKEDKGQQIQWNQVSKELFYGDPYRHKVYREGKQCRQRWNCFLNPKIKKGLWEAEEDIKLIQFILSWEGQKKWSKLVPEFGGRTENAIKNRYHLLMEKQLRLLGVEIKDDKELMQRFLKRSYEKIKISETKDIQNILEIKKINMKTIQTESNISLRIEEYQKQESFLQFFQSGLIYKEDKPEIKIIKLSIEELSALKLRMLENKENYLLGRMINEREEKTLRKEQDDFGQFIVESEFYS